MININTGGPAFPRLGLKVTGPDGQVIAHDPGMTLRDYFAAKAMQALLSDQDWRQDMDFGETASAAYRQADAMLKAREA
jgi:hypothetical protein